MRFVAFSEVADKLRDKRVAIVGGGPSCLQNDAGFVDGHDVVIRVNNYKTGVNQGRRCDIFYSFFGVSIRKSAEQLIDDGVYLCMSKVPDAYAIKSPWHKLRKRRLGVDFRPIFKRRADWWPCDTFVPDLKHFLRGFELLGRHVPTTGFSAILDVLACSPREVYLTGFDGFRSGVHNVDEKWRKGNPSDPIGHRPEAELAFIAEVSLKRPVRVDSVLSAIVASHNRTA